MKASRRDIGRSIDYSHIDQGSVAMHAGSDAGDRASTGTGVVMTTADEVNKLIGAAVEADAVASRAHAAVMRVTYGIDSADRAEALLRDERAADIASDAAWDAVAVAAHHHMRSTQHDGPPPTKRATPCGTGTLPAQRAGHEPPL